MWSYSTVLLILCPDSLQPEQKGPSVTEATFMTYHLTAVNKLQERKKKMEVFFKLLDEAFWMIQMLQSGALVWLLFMNLGHRRSIRELMEAITGPAQALDEKERLELERLRGWKASTLDVAEQLEEYASSFKEFGNS